MKNVEFLQIFLSVTVVLIHSWTLFTGEDGPFNVFDVLLDSFLIEGFISKTRIHLFGHNGVAMR
jgi:hypothetical protein